MKWGTQKRLEVKRTPNLSFSECEDPGKVAHFFSSPMEQLPPELLEKILKDLPWKDKGHLRQVSKGMFSSVTNLEKGFSEWKIQLRDRNEDTIQYLTRREKGGFHQQIKLSIDLRGLHKMFDTRILKIMKNQIVELTITTRQIILADPG